MITSTANEKVKYVRSLHRRSVRHKKKQFIVEGMRLVEEMNETGQAPVFVFHTELFASKPVGRELVDSLCASGWQVFVVTDRVMRVMADTETPQGILAVLPFPQLEPDQSGLTVVLDGVRDPGNLGTILRSADAAGIGRVITIKGAVDVFSPKVVRAAMGAHFRLPVQCDREWEELGDVLQGRQVLLADPTGDLPYHQVDWTEPTVLIVGGEAHGASRRARELALGRVMIPMRSDAESLNVAVATSIILFEAVRQRGPARS